jgi:polyisoprenoid-binding protein YceI
MLAAQARKHGFHAAIITGLALISLLLHSHRAVADAPIEIDTAHSSLTIRVYKTGLFSGFAHNHEVRAPIQQGVFDEEQQTVNLTVNARELRVMDPQSSASERSTIQGTMLGPKVLDSEKFQEIKFHSTRAEKVSVGKWNVEGELTLHGQTHNVNVNVEGAQGHYRGFALLHQKDFGIEPISLMGGSVKVKDEIRVEFDIQGKSASAEFVSPRLSFVQQFA